MRNAALTTVAPTGTLSILAGCSGGIEPLFSLAFERHILDGRRLWEVHPAFERVARDGGFYSEELIAHAAVQGSIQDRADVPAEIRRVFVCARDVAPRRHVAMQEAFQEFIDGAISKTINLPAGASAADVDEVYRLAFDAGCKGVTVYRDGCRAGQPMALVSPPAQSRACPNCRHANLPFGCVRCPSCGTTLCG
jgi:ribonucleoside-diphosphate reductase alpha chain